MKIGIAEIFKQLAHIDYFCCLDFHGLFTDMLRCGCRSGSGANCAIREGEQGDNRRGNLHNSIPTYKKRCDIMAGIVGLASAIVLIVALMLGELALIYPGIMTLKYASLFGAFLGLLLVILATAIVGYESMIIHRQLSSELFDLPQVARAIGLEPGKVVDKL